MNKSDRSSSGILRIIAALAALILVTAACAGDESPEQEDVSEEANHQLIVGVAALPITLDSMFAPGQESVEAIINLYDHLLCWDTTTDEDGIESADVAAGEDAMTSCLIENVEKSPDGTEYTLHVRRGVQNAEGHELTAEDIKYTFDRQFGTEAIGSYIMGVAAIPGPESVEIVDDYTVRVELEGPNPIFERVMYVHTNSPWDSTVVQEHATDDDPWATEWLKLNAAGFGPYQLREFTPGAQVVFERNPNYWGETPYFETVIYREIPESSQRLALLQQGEIDIAEGLTVRQAESLSGAEDVKVISTVKNQFVFAAMDNSQGPTADARIRQAINYAIPKDEILSSVYNDQARPLVNMVPSFYPHFDASLSPYEYDIDEARSLVEEAGYGDGLELVLLVNADIPEHSDIAVILADSLDEAGIDVSIERKPTSAYLEDAAAGNFGLFLHQTYAVVPDTAYHYATYVSPTGPLSYNNFQHERYEELIAQSSATPDGPERVAMLEELQQIVAAEAPQVSILEVPTIYGFNEKLDGYMWSTYNQLRFDDLRFAE